jgi:hypothetical protein
MPSIRIYLLASSALALALAGCGKDQAPAASDGVAAPAESVAAPLASASSAATAPAEDLGDFRIVRVSLGRSVDVGNDVTEERTVFSPRDAIYAVIISSGRNQGVLLTARWFDADGALLAKNDQRLVPDGPMLTNFRLKNPSGWARGHYRLEVDIDGEPSQTREFDIR